MASEPHAVPESPHGHDRVEMPRPTIAPLVVSLGMALLATGIAFGLSFLIAGVVLLACGLGLWSGQLLPGRGHVLVDPGHLGQRAVALDQVGHAPFERVVQVCDRGRDRVEPPVPFRVGIAQRDAWLRQMRRAVDSLNLDPADDATLWTYLERAAFFMVNVDEEAPGRQFLT